MKNYVKEVQIKQKDILKQLQKSQISSKEEYVLIISNLREQNQRLERDREDLKIRVDILASKQKQLNRQYGNPKTDFKKIKAELDKKYKQYDQLRKKSYKAINRNSLNIQCRTYLDQCHEIDQQINQLQGSLKDEKRSFKKLQKSIKQSLKHNNSNLNQREELEFENKELRKIIFSMRMLEDVRSHVEVRVQENKIGKQEKKREKERLKTLTVAEVKNEQLQDKCDILKLNKKNSKKMKTMIDMSPTQNKKEQKASKRQELQQRKQQLEEQAEALKQKRERLLYEKSLYQQKWSKYLKKKKMQEEKELIQKCDVCLQANFFQDEDPLRMEFVGIHGPLVIDDRFILKTHKQTRIIGLIYWETKYGLGFLKALYSNGKQTPEPKQLKSKQKKKVQKIILKQNDHIKWIKPYYSRKDKKVCRIQFYSWKKEKFQIGQKKQALMNDTFGFKFDNLPQETPVCLYCTYRQQSNQLLLSSFGVQINQQ